MSVIKSPTQEQIIQRFKERTPDLFGFETDEYIPYLDYETIKSFLREGVTKEEIEPDINQPLIREEIVDQIKEYLKFAWDKANNQRGISAGRSIEHFIAWTWLAGDTEFSDEIEIMYYENHHYYGKPILEKISEFYGVDWKALDNGVRTNG